MKRMLKPAVTPILSIAFLSNCVPTSGDFCEVYKDEIKFTRSTAVIVVQTDKEEAQKIDTRNTYWQRHCKP